MNPSCSWAHKHGLQSIRCAFATPKNKNTFWFEYKSFLEPDQQPRGKTDHDADDFLCEKLSNFKHKQWTCEGVVKRKNTKYFTRSMNFVHSMTEFSIG